MFTIPDIWTGGFYEMSLYLGPPCDERLRQTLTAIWNSQLLSGPFPSREIEPCQQRKIEGTLETEGHLYGAARVAPGVELPCGTFTFAEEASTGERVGDFVSLYIPLGALGTLFPVGAYPFGDHAAAALWRPEIDSWFLDILDGLRGRIHFEVGVIGWETELMSENVEHVKTTAKAADRFDGIVVPDSERLLRYPPTRFDTIKLG
jgi:hypothetical protein